MLNLITKAITAPFSLLTGGLDGGGGDSSVVPFDLGGSTLTPAAASGQGRQGLKRPPGAAHDGGGRLELREEREAYKRQRLRQLAQAEKRRVAV